MRNESKPGRPATGVAANDNGGAEARVQSAVLTIARLLGRQIAREQLRRSHAAATTGRPTAPRDREPDGSDNTTRAALYARYSSDQQLAASIDDQFQVCREHAERSGWTVAGGYRDAVASGASMIFRPGLQALIEDARRGSFDVVVAVALDRVSRDQADVAALYKHLQLAGVMIVTLAEGEISELHVGLKGTMDALYLKDLAAKTHRALRGRVEQGRSGGGLCYGYDVVKAADDAGEPVRRARTINEAEAAIVRRVFRDFATGVSPRAIAQRLNDEGVPGPSGKLWNDSAIRGHAKRGTGLVNNELYIGRLIWNRLRYVKNAETGKRVSRLNPPEAWIVKEVPELRIVDDALWQAVKARQGEITERYATVIEAVRSTHANRPGGARRPRHPLSGLLECGVCGGPCAMRGQDRYGCSNHVMNGSCANSRGIRRTVLEERVLAGLRERLMAPEAAAEAIRARAEETNRLNRERRAAGEADRRELAAVKKKKMATMIGVIKDGGGVRGMVDRLRKLQVRQDELEARLAAAPVTVPDVHPNVTDIYCRKVERLAAALEDAGERDEAAAAVRGLIERIVLTPGEKRGEMHVALHGDCGTALGWAGGRSRKRATDIPPHGMAAPGAAGAGRESAACRELARIAPAPDSGARELTHARKARSPSGSTRAPSA